VEISLITIDECFVYKVPPLRTASGHRAEDWNLANPIFTGCLKIFQGGDKLRLVVYSFKDPLKTSVTAENIQMFGECPIEVKPGENILGFVDAVIDSSRYYVVRIKDPESSRSTLVGVGFRDRECAFDFKNCLNDYVKFVNRMQLASQLAANAFSEAGAGAGVAAEEDSSCMDSSSGYASVAAASTAKVQGGQSAQWMHITPLAEGEKIKVKVGHKTEAGAGKAKPSGAGGGLRPPPPPGSVVKFQDAPAPAPATPAAPAAAPAEEDDWGDFSSA